MRIKFIDNLRWIIVVLVVIFHVVLLFNSVGSVTHFNTKGIPFLDSIGYFVYPWFMGCLFVLAGMSSVFSLQKRTKKDYLNERFKRLFVPFLTYIILFSYITAAFGFTVNNSWNDFASVPKPLLTAIMMLIGMGHIWFVLELFIVSIVFILILKLDKNNFLYNIGEKFNIFGLILLYVPLALVAQFLNVLGVFRNLFFLLLFIIGYCILSHKKVQGILLKYRIPMLVAALILFVIQMALYWGSAFADIVNKPLTLLYTWIMILAVIGNGERFLNFSNSFTRYMSKRSFLIYIFHYLPMVVITYAISTYLNFPIWLQYISVLVATSVVTIVIVEIVARIPVIRTLFGVKPKQNKINNINIT